MRSSLIRLVEAHISDIHASRLKWNGRKDRIWCCFDEELRQLLMPLTRFIKTTPDSVFAPIPFQSSSIYDYRM